MVEAGDDIAAEDSLITLESDKASMEIPSPQAGKVKEVKISVGDMVKEGSLILLLEAAENSVAEDKVTDEAPEQKAAEPEVKQEVAEEVKQSLAPPKAAPLAPPLVAAASNNIDEAAFKKAYASPGVRKFARELGADLGQIQGTADKGRITKEDVKAFVKQQMTSKATVSSGAASGLNIAPMPEVDFAKFGEIETHKLTKINKLTGQAMTRNWLTVPHVTQFDDVDITDMEAFRKSLANDRKNPVKLTPLVFIMKAVVAALQAYPRFNSSLANSGEELILKKYFHLGIAMDTPDGLVVPVIRDVDKKGLLELGDELRETSQKAREKKLKPADMQGGCFTISSLGGIGGTAFTPIVNAPEVAILGVSRSAMKPVWQNGEFVPRLMLPLSLSYDHRVIDGADGARFITYLGKMLADIRHLLM